MSNPTRSAPLGALTLAEPTPKTASLFTRIWLQPFAALEALCWAPGWAWLVPAGCALALFYAKLFTMAFLKAPVTWWTLLSGVLGIVIGWPLRAWLLTRIGALLGNQIPFTVSLTLSAWAAWPLVLRAAVQWLYMLNTGTVLASPGLAGLLAQPATMIDRGTPLLTSWLACIAQVVLSSTDLYTIWFCALLVQAVSLAGQLSRWRALLIVALYGLLSLAVAGLAIAQK